MKYLIYAIVFIILLLATNKILAQATALHVVNQVSLATTTSPVKRKIAHVQRKEPTPSQIALINKYATEYNVSAEIMTKVISCESGFVETARGDSGYSRGLVQIHAKYHPEVTYEQAVNPDFAIRFLAEKLSNNQGYLWTCWRLITKK